MLNKNLSLQQSIEVNTSADALWDVLTNPKKIAKYLFGTETITDWEPGSPITFQGSYEGKTYQDKGEVLEVELHRKLKYSYWSGFSGLEDLPENYFFVTYRIQDLGTTCIFTWSQSGFKNKESLAHTENNLPKMLSSIKELAEK